MGEVVDPWRSGRVGGIACQESSPDPIPVVTFNSPDGHPTHSKKMSPEPHL